MLINRYSAKNTSCDYNEINGNLLMEINNILESQKLDYVQRQGNECPTESR